VEANPSTSHWINQTSELETVGSPSLSEEEQEILPPMKWPLCKSTLQPFPVKGEIKKQQNLQILPNM